MITEFVNDQPLVAFVIVVGVPFIIMGLLGVLINRD
jgi:hypothetical protein